MREIPVRDPGIRVTEDIGQFRDLSVPREYGTTRMDVGLCGGTGTGHGAPRTGWKGTLRYQLV